jgi:ribosomal protein S18 acetylase RimI-like enzyme
VLVPFHVRPFERRDTTGIVSLYAAFMDELFQKPTVLTAEVLQRDGDGRHFSMVVAADRADTPIGFAAWQWDYDLHNAVRGANIPDLYVARAYRGRALAVRLVAAVASEAAREGGVYVRADVLQDDLARIKLVRRLTIGFPGESVYISGRAFRELSCLVDADMKTLVRGLPTREASREP